MMAVNNEVGTILPIDAAAQAIAQAKAPALLHVDAVQAFGKLPLKPSKSKIDLMSVSAHKIHGPKGVGALYVAGNVHIVPRTFGGGQEKDLRPGTEAMPLIAGFGAAVKALPNLANETKAVAQINEYCREQLSKLDGIAVNSPADALPYILNFSTCSVRSETMLHFLASKQIFVSSGSACSKAKPSHVLTAMELSRDRINSSLRISFSRYNTLEEAQQFIAALQQGLNEITKRPL
jgi:cysteine desulfurase